MKNVWRRTLGFIRGTARACDTRSTVNGDYYLLDGISFRTTG